MFKYIFKLSIVQPTILLSRSAVMFMFGELIYFRCAKPIISDLLIGCPTKRIRESCACNQINEPVKYKTLIKYHVSYIYSIYCDCFAFKYNKDN